MRLHLHSPGRVVAGAVAASVIFLGAGGAIPGTGWLGTGPMNAEAATCDVSDLSLSPQEQAFVALLNSYRGTSGVQPLVVSQPLTQASTWLAQDMASSGVLSHADSLGRGFVARLADCGISGVAVGENIAAGFTTAQGVFNAWQASPPHNANMVNPSFTQLGVAEVNGYWVTNFAGGTPAAATPPSTTAPAPTTVPVTPPTATMPVTPSQPAARDTAPQTVMVPPVVTAPIAPAPIRGQTGPVSDGTRAAVEVRPNGAMPAGTVPVTAAPAVPNTTVPMLSDKQGIIGLQDSNRLR